jgi:hypothetical protein
MSTTACSSSMLQPPGSAIPIIIDVSNSFYVDGVNVSFSDFSDIGMTAHGSQNKTSAGVVLGACGR